MVGLGVMAGVVVLVGTRVRVEMVQWYVLWYCMRWDGMRWHGGREKGM